MALFYFEKEMVKKIHLVRPAIEAGENLGFLPGDLQQKIDPYLRPMYDALEEIVLAFKELGLDRDDLSNLDLK